MLLHLHRRNRNKFSTKQNTFLVVIQATTTSQQDMTKVELQGVQGISDIITVPGLVNVDFADVKAIMSNAGSAMLGIGVGFGKNRAEDVARSAIMSPLLRSVSRPMGIVYNVTGGSDLTLHEVTVAAEIVYSMADPNANVIFGAVIDEGYQGMVRMTVIATGFQDPGIVDQKDIRTVDDDIFYWKQNPNRSKLTPVPEILRRRDSRRTSVIRSLR
jgi:cell division protein FtsZ